MNIIRRLANWLVFDHTFGIGIAAGIGIVTSVMGMAGSKKSSSAQKKQARELARLQKKKGKQQKDFNYEAAKEIIAIGRMNVDEEERQTKIIASRATAVAAAGGSIMDVGHLIADLHGEGAYRARVIMYEARRAERKLKFAGDQAEEFGLSLGAVTEAEGEARADATLLGGITKGATQIGSILSNL